MTKALRMMEEEVRLCDGIVLVLDARAPFACFNPKLESIFNNKPVVCVLNKCDLVSDADVKFFENELKKKGKNVISLVGTNEKSASKLYGAIENALKPVRERYATKGVNKPLRVMVSGIPNTGKSTLINLLCGGKRAKTGDKAGVTKDKQWVRVKGIELLDTPGTTPPSFENQTLAKYLAFIGSINDDIVDFTELSLELISYLTENYNGVIETVYKVETQSKTPLEIFNAIAVKRGAIIKGGEIDDERTSNIIIADLRKGKIGKIAFK